MTERLSDERLREIAERLKRRAEQAMGQLHCGSENWEYREAHKEADLNHDSVAALVELLDLRAENARLRERCTWLPVMSEAPSDERLRELGAKCRAAQEEDTLDWAADTQEGGNRSMPWMHGAAATAIDELLELRAKLAAGPVMPEVPQSELVLDELSRVMSWERAIEMYADIRTALLKEQSR